MPKDKRKIYKAVKKSIDGHDYLVVKIKNLRPLDIRELRTEINILTTDFFAPAPAAEYINEDSRYEDKHVKFEDEKKV